MEKNKPQNVTYYSSIEKLKFYILGDDENRQDSNVRIKNKEIIKDDRPVVDGIYDAHMGTTDHEWDCATCEHRKNICPGHPGSIELRYPCKSPMFRDEMLKWLKVVCYHCGSFLLPVPMDQPAKARLTEMVKKVRTIKTCMTCHRDHWQVAKDKQRPNVFYRTNGDGQHVVKQELFNHKIDKVLHSISEQMLAMVGKPPNCHPKNFIHWVVRVPENQSRPDIRRIGGTRSSNSDTTNILSYLVDTNNALPTNIPDDETLTRDEDTKQNYYNLDTIYYTMIKGGGGGDVKMLSNTKKPPVSISERIPKKSGRIRKNLLGKRSVLISRTVITGDSRLAVDQVGFPLLHARALEIPECVTEMNIHRLTSYFLNGPNKYPGCKHIIKRSDGHTYRIEYLDKNYRLQLGDVVLRDVIDGDYAMLNRQPSLLFSNISCMYIMVMQTGDTFRLNPSICNYFNADFDGDQMNAILLQNIMARNEARLMSSAAKWLLSPQNSAPLVGAFQDGLIGLTQITYSGIEMDKWHAMQLFSSIQMPNLAFTKRKYTSRELISMLLPPINMVGRSPSIYKPQYAHLIKYDPSDTKIEIRRGQHLSGVLDKAVAGQGSVGSIFHIISRDFGNRLALDVVYRLQQIVHQFFLYYGFTVGIADINVSHDALRKVKHHIDAMILESRKITQRLYSGNLIAPLGISLSDYYESEQMNALTPGDNFVAPIFSELDLDVHKMALLILSGSKGKISNFIAINAAIGSQTINGQRFPDQLGIGRTSIYSTRYDKEPDVNGYISMSFRQGVTNKVYPFAASEARAGAISNALSTSVAGTLNRLAIKNLESVIVDNLRHSSKAANMLQPLYAETGIDAALVEAVKYPNVKISTDEFKERYAVKGADFGSKYNKPEIDQALDKYLAVLINDRDNIRRWQIMLESHNPKEYIFNEKYYLPCQLTRLIQNATHEYGVDDTKSGPADTLDPSYAMSVIEKLCANLGYVYLNDIQEAAGNRIPHHIQQAVRVMQMMIRVYLAPAELLRGKITNRVLDIIAVQIRRQYIKSLIDYGTPVGVLAAQCISEPITQFVLDSKHRTGGQGGTKTNEIDRINEILHGKDTLGMANPRMLIMAKPEFESDQTKVREIANQIEMMQFGRFVKTKSIFYESYGKIRHPDYQKEQSVIHELEKLYAGRRIPTDLASWCIRFGIDRKELIMANIDIETIVLAVQKHIPELFVVYTPENYKDLFVRCYLRTSQLKQNVTNFILDVLRPMLDRCLATVVRGVQGILGTDLIHVIKHYVDTDGSLKDKKVYGIAANGTNLEEILTITDIDPTRTLSDSIKEVEQMFGIVAARNKIINEMIATLKNLNRAHCTIFADEMTYTGEMLGIQITGLQAREMSNITLRIAFKSPVQVIQHAAINGMTDTISGISGPLLMGNTPKVGSLYNDVIVNQEFLKRVQTEAVKDLEDL